MSDGLWVIGHVGENHPLFVVVLAKDFVFAEVKPVTNAEPVILKIIWIRFFFILIKVKMLFVNSNYYVYITNRPICRTFPHTFTCIINFIYFRYVAFNLLTLTCRLIDFIFVGSSSKLLNPVVLRLTYQTWTGPTNRNSTSAIGREQIDLVNMA